MPVVVVDEAEFGVIILAGPLDGLFHITCRGYLPIGGVGIGGDGFGCDHHLAILHLGADAFHQFVGGVVAIGGGGVLVHGAVLRGGFVVMPGLHPVNLLAELRLAGCIRVLRSFAVAFLNRNLLVAYPSGVGGGRCAFYRGRLLIGVVDDLDIEPAAATGTSRKLDTMRLKYQHVILILSKKGERILRPRGACKPAAYGAI